MRAATAAATAMKPLPAPDSPLAIAAAARERPKSITTAASNQEPTRTARRMSIGYRGGAHGLVQRPWLNTISILAHSARIDPGWRHGP